MRRRLAVILASDVAGYSRLMALDEETTVARFSKLRAAFEEIATSHHGRVFNTAGDAILVEFQSPTDAVRCAIDVQETARTRNGAYPASQSIQLRIGIALGDVLVQENGDLLGDGVNIAARLEGLAQPGGIVIAEDVHGHVERNLSTPARDLGPQALKNINRPVRAFALAQGGQATPAPAVATAPAPLIAERPALPKREGAGRIAGRDEQAGKGRSAGKGLRGGLGPLGAGLMALALIGAGGWWYIGQPNKPAPQPAVTQPAKPPVAPPRDVAQPPAKPPEEFGPRLPDGWTPPDLAAELRAALEPEIDKLGLPAAIGSASEIASGYVGAQGAKALAALPGSGFWQARRGNEREAAIAALESCHLTYGKPCVLIARGESVLPETDELRRTPQFMPRLVYSGAFDPARIPILGPAERGRADVAGYAQMTLPKAMAIHALGRVAVATGANSQDAEAKALAHCDGLGSVAVEGPCRTYALDNTVVLPQRRSLAR